MDAILSLLNFAPGLKRKMGAMAALVLAVIAAWNSAAPELDLADYTLRVPDLLNAAVLALIGVGTAAGQKNDAAKLAAPKP